MQSGVSSSTLITVAVITAVSSLLAAGIAALIAYKIAKNNLIHAANLAEREREAQREKFSLERKAQQEENHRTAQREAYAAYVTAALTALRDISQLRNISDTTEEVEKQKVQATARDSYYALAVSLGRVRIEDREKVAKAANTLQQALRDYWLAALKSNKGADGSSENDMKEKNSAALGRLGDFEETAYAALQGS